MKNVEIDYKAIGKRIRYLRKNKRMTQEKLANFTNLAPNHISNIETGATKLSLPALLQIAISLDTDVNTLLYDNLPSLVEAYDADIKAILADCSSNERAFLIDLLTNAKAMLRKNNLK